MLIAQKIRLDPNNVQATYFARASGIARFAYNWALEEWSRQYQAHVLDRALPKPNEAALRRQLNAIKRAKFPWMQEVTKCAPQIAIQQLGKAFDNFFARRAAYPTFRCKGTHDRFTLSNDQIRIKDWDIRIPKLGWVRMREKLRLTGHIVSACIRRIADCWYASITIDTLEDRFLPPSENQGAVGVDLGVSHLATLSTGEVFNGSKAQRHARKRLRRLSRAVSRKVKGSRNRSKAKSKLARQHARVANIRSNDLHQATTSITWRFHTIGIEDLNVKGMLGNRYLSKAIADMGFGEFRRQLEYKARWRGGQIVVVDRWYPSSKTCSCCGVRTEALTLSQRRWHCDGCGATHDRDVNAALNLKNLAVSSTVSACGGEGAGPARERGVKSAPVKQEFNSRARSK